MPGYLPWKSPKYCLLLSLCVAISMLLQVLVQRQEALVNVCNNEHSVPCMYVHIKILLMQPYYIDVTDVFYLSYLLVYAHYTYFA